MKLIEKFKEQPLSLKLILGIILTWIYPFIESMSIGARGFFDLSIFANILAFIGLTIFAYLGLTHFFIPIGKWIGNLLKKKSSK